MKKILLISMVTFLAVIVTSCSDNASGEIDELDVDQALVEQVSVGYEINDIIDSESEIEETTDPSQYNDDEDIGLFQTKNSVLENLSVLKSKAQNLEVQHSQFSKISEDSLIWFFTDTNFFSITRTYFYSDPETGIIRMEIAVDHLVNLRFKYDSLSVRFDNNEEHLLSVYELRILRELHRYTQIERTVNITSWNELGDPTEFSHVTIFSYNENFRNRSDRVHIVKATHTMEVSAGISWTLKKEFVFSDETTSLHEIVFVEGGGTFTKQFRNGTTTTGSFNDLYDDGIGSWESTTTFVPDFYIAEIFKSANIVLDRQAQTITTDLRRIITFADESIDSVNVNIIASRATHTIVMTAEKSNGAHGQITLTKLEDEVTIEGTWTNKDGNYIIISGHKYEDRSGTITYYIYESETAYNNGDDPIAEVTYEFSGDGRGDGTITRNGERYDIRVDDNGKGEIRKGNSRKDINLHR